MNAGGIYEIRHTGTGRVYVGSSVGIRKRFAQHRNMLAAGRHHTPRLQRAWARDGEAAFTFSIIEIVEDPAELVTREQFHMDRLAAATRTAGYNVLPQAGSSRGAVMPPEVRAKISAALKGRQKSPEHAAKVGAANRGKIVTEESRAKIRTARASQVFTEEARLKMGASHRGRPLSEQHRARIAAANTGFRHSAESNAKNRAAHLGRKATDETRAKMSAAQPARRTA